MNITQNLQQLDIQSTFVRITIEFGNAIRSLIPVNKTSKQDASILSALATLNSTHPESKEMWFDDHFLFTTAYGLITMHMNKKIDLTAEALATAWANHLGGAVGRRKERANIAMDVSTEFIRILNR